MQQEALKNLMEETLGNSKVLVVGDVMLDRYWMGSANRISSEAPVPIVLINECEERPGGAANVARNVSALGVNTSLLSVVGGDEAGRALAGHIKGIGINSALRFDPEATTTVKLRIVARHQQIIRVDFENELHAEAIEKTLVEFEKMIQEANLVVFSDYNKGMLKNVSDMISMAKQYGVPVLVDPKGDDYSKYKGANVVTPNRQELSQIIGYWRTEDELIEKAQNLRESLEVESLLLTRSEEGMTLFCDDGALNIPSLARDVFDVTGAGDTVIGVLGALMSSGVPIRSAMHFANKAAGLVVGRLGTSAVSLDELLGGDSD